MTNEDDSEGREPAPFDWDKYLARVKESAEAAERHLEVPAGTITSIPNEPDFIATVKTYAVIEPLLNDLIAKGTPQTPYGSTLRLMSIGQSVNENFRTFVTALNISGRTGKLRLAEGLGLLQDYNIEFIEAVTRVRNRYAHNQEHAQIFDRNPDRRAATSRANCCAFDGYSENAAASPGFRQQHFEMVHVPPSRRLSGGRPANVAATTSPRRTRDT
jgi:hypothetical protein